MIRYQLQIFVDVSKDYCAFILKIKQSPTYISSNTAVEKNVVRK